MTPVKLADLASSSPTPNAVAGLVAKGALKGVHFQTDDLDAMSERVGDAGAEIVSEPAEQFSGSRRPLGGRDLEWARCMQPTATT